MAVDRDVDDEVAAGHTGDPRVLLVDRVAFEDAAIGPGVLEQRRAVPPLHRLDRGDAGTDQLAAARVAGHQMRLDQSRGNLQVGVQVARIDPGRDSPLGRTDERMLFQAGAVVVLDAVRAHDVLAEHLDLLGRGAGPVQSRRDQEQDLVTRDACLVQHPEDRAEDRRVGHRPGDVAHQDAGAGSAAGHLAKRRRADRVLECPGDGRLGIREAAGRREWPAARRRDRRVASPRVQSGHSPA